jgi:hypothetical protein
MSASYSSCIKAEQYGLTFKAFFTWFSFFAMDLEVLMIITMTISFVNTEWKWWLLCCTNLNWFWVHIVWVYSDFSPTKHTETLQLQHILTLNLDTNCKNTRTRTCASCTYLPSTNWYGQLMDPKGMYQFRLLATNYHLLCLEIQQVHGLGTSQHNQPVELSVTVLRTSEQILHDFL